MRTLIKTAGLLIIFAGLTAVAASAQNWNGPWGSYRQSCRDIRDDGRNVYANCQRTDGSWNNTRIDYRNCNGQITNDNGNLRCGNTGSWQGYGDWQNGMPRGDYMDSCRDVHMRGDDLVGNCRRRNGSWNRTRLDKAYQCRGGVINDDGNFRCSGNQGWHGRGHGHDRDDDDYGYQGGWQGGNNSGVPRGNYLRTCRNARMNGNRLEADCQRTNGSWNDTALDNAYNCRDIVNSNGDLRCNSGNTGGIFGGWGNNNNNGQVPRGSYMRSCRNARMNGNRLQADCQRSNGSWNDTALDNAYNCRDIVNSNGDLRCNR